MSGFHRGLAIAAIGALTLSGCSSVPVKAASGQSLVVIKTELINPDSMPRGREMSFQFSGGYPPSVLGQYSWDFNAVVVREPGVIFQSLATRVQAGFQGKPWELPVNMTLPYDAGRIVIADFVFVSTIRQFGDKAGVSHDVGFRIITPQEKKTLLHALQSDERFASWVK